jgi:hypothetical protein
MLALGAALFLAAGGAASAQDASTFPELSPNPLAVGLAQAGEPLGLETLAEAALVFSGTPEASLEKERALLSAHIRAFNRAAGGVKDQERAAEAALEYLHRNVLTTYRVSQTRVDTALETGSFNCVSSAVLYLILARSVGLAVEGVRTADHAFCTVTVDGSPVDVETTNLYGFNPGTKKEFRDLFGKATGYSYVPPSHYADRRVIGEKELLALILTNRVADQTDRGGFREALPAAASAYALVRNKEFRRTLLVAVSNYSVWLGSRGDFNRARALVDAAAAAYGPDPSLQERRQQLFHNQAVSLIEDGSTDAARRLLGQSAAETPLDPKDWTDLSVYLVQKDAETAARSGDFLAAARLLAGSMEHLGRIPEILQAYEAYIHNQFAALFNAKRFADARLVISSGLAVYHESRVLKQDNDIIEKALRSQ